MDEPKRTGNESRRSNAMSGGKPLKLGVYDRPASADRPKALRIVVIAVVAVAALLIAYFIFGQRKAHSAAVECRSSMHVSRAARLPEANCGGYGWLRPAGAGA